MMDFLPLNICRDIYFSLHPRWMFVSTEYKTHTVAETEHARLMQSNDYHIWKNVDTGTVVENRMTAYGKQWKNL